MTLVTIIQTTFDYEIINYLQDKIDIHIDNDTLSKFKLCGLDIVNENSLLIKIIKYVDKHLLYFVEKKDSYLFLAINNYIVLTNLIYSKKNDSLSYSSSSEIIKHLENCSRLFNSNNNNIKKYNNLLFSNLEFIENWEKKIIFLNSINN
jgi:hypothetical protein